MGDGTHGDAVAAVALIERLRQPAAAKAAWRDLFDWDSGSVSLDDARHLTATLREIDESLGPEWSWRVGPLRRTALAEFAVDGEELLAAPTASAKVAWFVFADADLASGYLRVGQIQFFSSRLWPEVVT